MHRLCEVKSSESAALILTVGSRRRAKCSLETPLVNGEVFEVEEIKRELLAARPGGPGPRAFIRGRVRVYEAFLSNEGRQNSPRYSHNSRS